VTSNRKSFTSSSQASSPTYIATPSQATRPVIAQSVPPPQAARPAPPQPAPPQAPRPTPKTQSISARAIYDYTADEDNEISFAEGDVVSDIEKVDEGWWKGSCAGRTGLFPATYVEDIQGGGNKEGNEDERSSEMQAGEEKRLQEADDKRRKDMQAAEERRLQEADDNRRKDMQAGEERRLQDVEDKRRKDLQAAEENRLHEEDKKRKEMQAGEERRLKEVEDKRRRDDEERISILQREDEQRQAAAAQPPRPAAPGGSSLRARAIYDYPAGESNEIDLVDGEVITDVVQVDEGWWTGTNSQGRNGLFPSNYVEVLEEARAAPASAPPSMPTRPAGGVTATALYDYDVNEEGEIALREGDRITGIEESSDDWWLGTCGGVTGLFPSSYVEKN
jgi:hypothetical protein